VYKVYVARSRPKRKILVTKKYRLVPPLDISARKLAAHSIQRSCSSLCCRQLGPSHFKLRVCYVLLPAKAIRQLPSLLSAIIFHARWLAAASCTCMHLFGCVQSLSKASSRARSSGIPPHHGGVWCGHAPLSLPSSPTPGLFMVPGSFRCFSWEFTAVAKM